MIKFNLQEVRMKTYHRKTKIIGKKEFTDNETGEIVSLGVIQVEERDFNFEKIWLGHIVQSLDIIGNKKMKVITHIMQNRNRDNIFIGTYRELEKKLNISFPTIAETFKILQDSDFLVMVQQGVYRLNPNIIFKGTINNRMDILIRYQKEKAEVEKNEQEEQIIDHITYIDNEIIETQKRLEELRRERKKVSDSQEIERKEQKTS